MVLWVQFPVGAGSSHTKGGLACGPMTCYPSGNIKVVCKSREVVTVYSAAEAAL